MDLLELADATLNLMDELIELLDRETDAVNADELADIDDLVARKRVLAERLDACWKELAANADRLRSRLSADDIDALKHGRDVLRAAAEDNRAAVSRARRVSQKIVDVIVACAREHPDDPKQYTPTAVDSARLRERSIPLQLNENI